MAPESGSVPRPATNDRSILISCPGSQRVDDPCLLCHGDEPVRRHEALARMVPAHERLDRVNGPGREEDLRLIVQRHLALRDRAAQLPGQAGTAQALRLLLRRVNGATATRAL